MDTSDQNSTAIVTGGAKRLGRECCLRLAKLGYDVAIVFNHSGKEAAELAEELSSTGARSFQLKRDLRDVEQCESVIREVRGALGVPSVLVNNASIFEKGLLRSTSTEEFDADFAIHARAPFILTREFANLADSGLVVNMLDTRIAGHRTTYFAYLLSKKTLYEMTKIAAAELGPQIRVNAIAPGFILPPENDPDFAKLAALAERIPAKRQGAPDDIAAALEFFVKNEFVTGETIFVDGGERL
ncbi:MAG: SDR family oxidoreductase [Kiritimatiellaeota bacterium]|nr:SDR family oxidoreductase [Kiritimatiellota bacterium]